MNKKLSLILFSIIISAVFASFVAISLEDRIKNSELIIIGDLDSIKYKAIDIT